MESLVCVLVISRVIYLISISLASHKNYKKKSKRQHTEKKSERMRRAKVDCLLFIRFSVWYFFFHFVDLFACLISWFKIFCRLMLQEIHRFECRSIVYLYASKQNIEWRTCNKMSSTKQTNIIAQMYTTK